MLTRPGTLTPELEALLARAMFPDPERLRRTLESYRLGTERQVYAWVVGGQPVSAAGIRQQGEPAGRDVEVLHLGTTPGQEGRGHARALLHAVAAHLNAARLVAETDDSAVGFYRRAGFEVSSIPSRWDWVRYRCVLTPS
ncbi:hypothetical protein Dcar01_02028 [Deinococcus carri]|uniref:N-acetyltransferase domain-containing protein n=1 Tax=Deinococcus carri TaxID=1211323 RepID=A0ABP9W970_9DEIO